MYRVITLLLFIYSSVLIAQDELIESKEELNKIVQSLKKIENASEEELQAMADHLNQQPKDTKKINDLIAKLQKNQAHSDKLVAEREQACLSSTNNIKFCSCISGPLPAAWTFEQYEAISTQTRAENGYESLPPVYQRGYRVVEKVSKECASKL